MGKASAITWEIKIWEILTTKDRQLLDPISSSRQNQEQFLE